MAELSTAQEEAAALKVSTENVHCLSWLMSSCHWQRFSASLAILLHPAMLGCIHWSIPCHWCSELHMQAQTLQLEQLRQPLVQALCKVRVSDAKLPRPCVAFYVCSAPCIRRSRCPAWKGRLQICKPGMHKHSLRRKHNSLRLKLSLMRAALLQPNS